MALNLELVKHKLQELQKTQQQSSLLWRPEPGDNDIRILPYKHTEDKHSFLELYFYYPPKPPKDLSVCKKTTLSPISFKRPDPIVEFCEELQNEGSKEKWVLGAKLKPKRRTFVPILVRGKEKEGPKFWGISDKVYKELLLLAEDELVAGGDDITDLRKGTDVKVNLTKAAAEGAFDQTTVRLARKPSEVTTDKDVMEQIKDMKPITELYPEPSYESLKIQLEQWLGGSLEEQASDSKSEKQSKTVVYEDDQKHESSIIDMEKEFDDLFDEK